MTPGLGNDVHCAGAPHAPHQLGPEDRRRIGAPAPICLLPSEERPHRGLSLAVPAGNRTPQVRGTTRTPVERRDVLGGLIHEYRWAA